MGIADRLKNMSGGSIDVDPLVSGLLDQSHAAFRDVFREKKPFKLPICRQSFFHQPHPLNDKGVFLPAFAGACGGKATSAKYTEGQLTKGTYEKATSDIVDTAAAAGKAATEGAKPLSGNAYKLKLIEVAVKRAALLAAGAKPYWVV